MTILIQNSVINILVIFHFIIQFDSSGRRIFVNTLICVFDSHVIRSYNAVSVFSDSQRIRRATKGKLIMSPQPKKGGGM